MDWITGLQKAIDYIEDNLTNELDYTEIAGRACSSTFHFQRVFGILCGYSLGEYIRNRRLTLAGSELASSDVKIIDTALKYGYDSPESFGRAFTRFHGITPSYAKTEGAKLKSFSRLSVKLILDGGNIMNYRIEKKDAFDVIMKKKYFPTDIDLSNKQLPIFWDSCRKDGTISVLGKYITKDNIFGNAVAGICFEDSTKDDEFPYAIGVEFKDGDVAEGLDVEKIPAHTWAIFECIGVIPVAIQDLLHKIYSDFFPTSDYKPYGGIDIQVYPDGNMQSPKYKCEIWIAVKKK
ncbi:helix-turn-helix domain-containing protein [Anaerocolumna sedimenticola]|uniref:Helix-turn-helix domain-containing protein n=1 Tax=Anaerocolumna sedimenticola TaxID=2696063 RepID=A0A6P1TQI3_9FIRM|nr:AraC family transcriptional regulator [Anaerocolumna sedimenticola]QHQ63214.1 helix-turn-helix domain-containing protein [Anaerocolumna sedimenticola]